MSRSATSSDPGAARRRQLGLAAGIALLVAGSSPGQARVFLTLEEALELALPGCAIERRTVYLTEAQLARARALAGVAIDTALVHPYAARRDGKLVATAYFDAHRVRTQPETLMIVVDPEGRVQRIELLAFAEPPDYIPRAGWYRQFEREGLGENLQLQRGIRPVTGATLTARATTEAVRRVLAIHRVLAEGGAK